MAGVLEFASTGEYRDERLYLLKTVERLEKKQDELIEQLAVANDRISKIRTDVNQVGDLGRKNRTATDNLTRRCLRMEVKAGSIATLAGILAAGAIETLKHFLFPR